MDKWLNANEGQIREEVIQIVIERTQYNRFPDALKL
jgi:hypothetical protein